MYINKEEALKNYGHISDWDVSLITNMSYLFASKTTFNSDISYGVFIGVYTFKNIPKEYPIAILNNGKNFYTIKEDQISFYNHTYADHCEHSIN